MDGSIGALAADLVGTLDRHLIVAASSEARAAAIARAAWVLAPRAAVHHLPAWDADPGERARPSRAVMGCRMSALAAIGAGPGPHLLVAPAETLVQRVRAPDPRDLLRLEVGDRFDPDAIRAELDRLGYIAEDRVSAPGEVAFHATVTDLFAADAERPARVRVADGVVAAIDLIDAETQRSVSSLPSLCLRPAVEPTEEGLVSVFDLLPGARLLLDEDAAEWVEEFLGRAIPGPLYMAASDWAARAAAAEPLAEPEWEPLPSFRETDRLSAARTFVRASSRPVGLSGPRLAHAFGLDQGDGDWATLTQAAPGRMVALRPGLDAGFMTGRAAVLADADVFPPRRSAADLFATPWRPGDAVVHVDHGVAVLEGLATIDAGVPEDCLTLRFAGDQRRLVKHDEMDRIFRHGAGTGVTLDRLGAHAFGKRRAAIEAAIADTARALLAEAEARRATPAPVLRPPARRLARFAAGFAHVPTPDQSALFREIADDLAAGLPMDRVVVGDVGFGKTEAALRAAAIAVLAGRQVAVLAPTTVLVRQHALSFARRFRDLGIETASLSRLTKPAEAAKIRARLADGSLRLVVGTTALAKADFAELGLTIVDEEQRFGARDKQALARLRDGVHVLTMTATPIPRTLEQALAGLRDLSLLATPPARRQPVRTSAGPFDPVGLRAALLREHAAGGQSFVVVPRIDGLEEMAALLGRIVPDLSVIVLHGRMKPDALDAAIVGFAEGRGDVLLSTNIVEAGLDIPRANTLVVCDADRFGLGQLHQLRGRVGRGRARGTALLFTDPSDPPEAAAASRLDAIVAHDGLGAGFAVSGQDLDLRGGGDLLGEKQAGHARVLGPELARHLLDRALKAARGETVPSDLSPVLTLGVEARLPPETVPDEEARINLYLRLARTDDAAAIAEEVADRFGPPPPPVAALFRLSELRATCRRLGVQRLESGPDATVAHLLDGRRLRLRRRTLTAAERLLAAEDLVAAHPGREPAHAA